MSSTRHRALSVFACATTVGRQYYSDLLDKPCRQDTAARGAQEGSHLRYPGSHCCSDHLPVGALLPLGKRPVPGLQQIQSPPQATFAKHLTRIIARVVRRVDVECCGAVHWGDGVKGDAARAPALLLPPSFGSRGRFLGTWCLRLRRFAFLGGERPCRNLTLALELLSITGCVVSPA
jgi:hypothetical protein